MTILVTGASGFIGRHVMELLGDRATPFGGDLRDPDSYVWALRAIAPNACLHLAWIGIPDLEGKAWENLNASARFFEELKQAGASLVIGAGSCFEYGNAMGAAKEGDARPQTGFAKTKDALHWALHRSGMAYRWARLFYVYPNRLTQRADDAFRPRLKPRFEPEPKLDWRPDNPEHVHDFIYVKDAAKGLVSLLENECASGAYNIGSGTPRSVAEAVNAISLRYDRGTVCKPPATLERGLWADMTKMHEATGFVCQKPFAP